MLLALSALVVAFAVGCRTVQVAPPGQSIFPLEPGRRWLYDTSFYGPNGRGTTTEVAVCRIRDSDQAGRVFLIATCADGQLAQTQFVFGHGQEVVQPLVVTRGGDPRPRDPPEVIARFDMRVGQAWEWKGKINNDEWRSSYRVASRGRVITPAGEFEAVRLLVADTSGGGPPAIVERWYATGVGLVKEAGTTFLPGDQGRPVPVELVRILKEQSVVPVEQIVCCQKVPGG